MSAPSTGDHEHPGPKSECEICRNQREFDMPAALVEACVNDRLVVFAGAGISTESRSVLRETLYDRIAGELGTPRDNESFPDLMSRFQAEKTRRLLLQRIRERMEYVNAFPELRRRATRFHRELATIFHVQDIITTNWDTYFEEETGALSFVTADDYALWDMPGRKVFKIHGSTHNLGSIVATSEDYRRCHRALSRGILGATLKHLLATKTALFVGYSFRDSDFNQIYRFINREMADVFPRSYIVNLDEDVPGAAQHAHLIRTDAAFFLQELKSALLPLGCLLDDRQWDAIGPALYDIEHRHHELYDDVDLQRLPAAVLCGHYQDGLIHAFERMLERRGTGEYSHVHWVQAQVQSYEALRKQYVRSKRYHDAAYAEGYQNGLIYLISDDRDRAALPLYFVYGSKKELKSLAALKREAARAKELHGQAYKEAERMAKRWSPGIVPHHAPQL